MRPRVTGFQFYIDEETLTGDGQMGNPIRVVSLAAPQNPSTPPGVSDAPPGQVFIDTSAIPHLAYVFTGPTATDWQLVGSGGGGGGTVFQYVVTGLEVDPTNLVIALPAAQPSANYGVVPSQEQFTALLAMGVLTASKTVAQFVLSLSAPSTAGDIFTFLVQAL